MAKGAETLTWEIALGIIILVGLLAIIAYALFGLTNQKIPFEVSEADQLEEGIACSYWRCMEGCRSTHLKDTATLNCRSEFCLPNYTDTGQPDGKICNDDAKKHPVIVNIPNGVGLGLVVTQTTLSQLMSTKDQKKDYYISPSGDNCADLGAVDVAYFDNKNVIQTETTSGWKGCLDLTHFLGGPNFCNNKVEISYGTYYIWTALNKFGIPGSFNTMACSEPLSSYVSTTTTVPGCGDAGGVCYPETCPTGSTLLQGKCLLEKDVTKVCCKAQS